MTHYELTYCIDGCVKICVEACNEEEAIKKVTKQINSIADTNDAPWIQHIKTKKL